VKDLERQILHESYCDHLREQIALEPRGPEWASVLSKRLADLSPFVGVPILFGTIHTPTGFWWIRIEPESRRVIHFEEHPKNENG
jgi:hypothetical protein